MADESTSDEWMHPIDRSQLVLYYFWTVHFIHSPIRAEMSGRRLSGVERTTLLALT